MNKPGATISLVLALLLLVDTLLQPGTWVMAILGIAAVVLFVAAYDLARGPYGGKGRSGTSTL